MKLPIAKTDGIVVQNLNNETLIYDLKTNKSYYLNETSSAVYQHCDGKTSFNELKGKTSYPDELIFFALDQLGKENLIEPETLIENPVNKINRRETIRRIGLGSLFALPLVTSLVAPKAAQAASLDCSGACLPLGCPVGYGPTGACYIGAPQCCSGVAQSPGRDPDNLCRNHVCVNPI